MAEDLKRINKFISETGFCSRREADKLLEEKRVTINGKLPELGTKVSAADRVEIDGKWLKGQDAEKHVYLAFNKPVGITCTTELHIKSNIINFINHSRRIFPIGRLDKPSEGLIFLTSDGDIVNRILRAGNQHEKEYHVTLNKTFKNDFIEKMSNGVPILDTITQKCYVERLDRNQFKIVLTQGLNRQIRRMCLYFGFEVIKLKRVRIMNVSLKNLAIGKWRNLSENELKLIMQMVETSSKTEEASYFDTDFE